MYSWAKDTYGSLIVGPGESLRVIGRFKSYEAAAIPLSAKLPPPSFSSSSFSSFSSSSSSSPCEYVISPLSSFFSPLPLARFHFDAHVAIRFSLLFRLFSFPQHRPSNTRASTGISLKPRLRSPRKEHCFLLPSIMLTILKNRNTKEKELSLVYG